MPRWRCQSRQCLAAMVGASVRASEQASERGERSCELKAGHADDWHTASVHPCILCSSLQLTGFQAKQLMLSTTLQGFQASVYRVDSAELKHTVGASAKQAVQYQKLKSV